ncbi:MAG TPA: two-component regulator propeller domain-containing protein [Acidobacteriaceae bacterium]|nr:two-component regulator propeller domain-containing protein [Acidobacteriaceae bacterium]
MQPLLFALRAWPLRTLFCVLVMACGLSPAGGQNLKYLSQQSWSTEEGLPQSSVHSIVQTTDGYVWLATEGGLVRFDGVAFQTFDRSDQPAFTSDDVCCLVAESDGLWIGTADGVLWLQGGQFHRYGTADGLASSAVASIHTTREGGLFVETADGWSQWNNTGFTRLPNAPAELKADGAGLVAVRESSRWRFSSTVVSAGGREWHVGKELPTGRIQTVLVDREGLAWVGMNSGLFVLSAEKSAATAVSLLNGNSVLSLFEDAEGNHWVGTETSGVHILRRLAFRSEAALADQAVTSVAQTKDGSIWVGTRDAGLRRVRSDGQPEQIPENKLTSGVILCLAPEWSGGLWVGTPDGLNYIGADHSVQRITSADGLPDDYIRALVGDSDGSVWVGTRQGLAHLQKFGEHLSVRTLTTNDGLGGNLIGALMFKSGDLWAATSGGLSVVHSDATIRNFTARDGLGATIATAMAEDSAGHLWVAGNNGSLSYLSGQRFVPVGRFEAQGRDGNIEGITNDRLGYFWLRMDRGIRRIAVNALTACVGADGCTLQNGAMVPYGLADGLPNDEVVAGEPSEGWLTTHGEIWFPTRGGVAIVDAEHLPANAAAPPIVLQRFSVDDLSERIGSGSIDIPFGHARFTMEYAGLSFTAPSEVRYRFRLDGFDKNWADAGNRRSATYTNLTPGRYVFHVQARNKDGGWNGAGAELRFRIVPPIYRRWWFLLLSLLLILALVAGMYLLRLRRLEREFDAVLAERNRMAREIHDTLTQDFVGASLQLDLIAQHLNRGKFELALEQVKRTRQLVTEGLEEARRSIWELRVNNSQDSLPTRLSKVVQRDTFNAIHPRLHVGGAYRVVDLKVERELLRIAQEALTNVLHHARSAETSVELHYSSDMLMLTIEDKGVGFRVNEASGKTGHYGLLGMKERAATIDGVLDVISEPGRGTKVTLRVPIAQSAR